MQPIRKILNPKYLGLIYKRHWLVKFCIQIIQDIKKSVVDMLKFCIRPQDGPAEK